tara:strand:- start:7512 stop:8393 length:882 start_codon:yes stop_codon:yes gene_type:complete
MAGLSAEPLKVAVSVLPQAGFVERVGGSHVEVIVLVDEGKDPHSFSPTPKRVTSITEADIWFTSGMPFEDPLLKKMKQRKDGPLIVSMNQGIDLAPSADCEHHHHDHEHEHEEHAENEGEEEHHAHDHHDHGEFDPHSWLSPALIPVQLVTIASELGKLDPEHADEFEANASAFADEVFDLDERLVADLAPLKGSTFYVFHAAFGYFSGAYGLTQEAIETGGREPSAKHLTKLIDDARKDGVKLIFVQPQFSDASARKIAEQIGATVLSVDPLDKDVLGTLRSIADAVKASRG